jgi:hypothetical protein
MPHLTAGEHWLLTRATAETNKIVIDSVDAATGVFTAHYATIANPSVFRLSGHDRR